MLHAVWEKLRCTVNRQLAKPSVTLLRKIPITMRKVSNCLFAKSYHKMVSNYSFLHTQELYFFILFIFLLREIRKIPSMEIRKIPHKGYFTFSAHSVGQMQLSGECIINAYKVYANLNLTTKAICTDVMSWSCSRKGDYFLHS